MFRLGSDGNHEQKDRDVEQKFKIQKCADGQVRPLNHLNVKCKISQPKVSKNGKRVEKNRFEQL